MPARAAGTPRLTEHCTARDGRSFRLAALSQRGLAAAPSAKLCGRLAGPWSAGLAVPALPCQPARHIARPSGEPFWRRPGRSSARRWPNKAAPWREDALDPTFRVSASLLSGPESTHQLIAGYAASLTRYRTTIRDVYGSTHLRGKNLPGIRIQGDAPACRSWCVSAAPGRRIGGFNPACFLDHFALFAVGH